MNAKPFSTKFDWGEFHNSWKLTDFQKYRIKRRYRKEVKDTIQHLIDQSINDKDHRRDELNSHNDPTDPFRLDLGGEG